MVKRRRRKPELYPRSFLASADLDLLLERQARKRSMTKSQLIRHLLEQQLAYEGVKGADKLTSTGEDE
jgi:hypothetical protein